MKKIVSKKFDDESRCQDLRGVLEGVLVMIQVA